MGRSGKIAEAMRLTAGKGDIPGFINEPYRINFIPRRDQQLERIDMVGNELDVAVDKVGQVVISRAIQVVEDVKELAGRDAGAGTLFGARRADGPTITCIGAPREPRRRAAKEMDPVVERGEVGG